MAKAKVPVTTSYEIENEDGDVEYENTLEQALNSAAEGATILEVTKKVIGYAKVTTTLSKTKES